MSESIFLVVGEDKIMATFLEGIEMNEERFIGLLTNLVGESRHLQNNPAQGRDLTIFLFDFSRLRVDSSRRLRI